jgi:dihydrofolate reductase
MRFTFVPGLTAAIGQARAVAAAGHVVIMGGGDVIGQAIEMGLIDELHLHIAPMLLGGGTPMFRYVSLFSGAHQDVTGLASAVAWPDGGCGTCLRAHSESHGADGARCQL